MKIRDPAHGARAPILRVALTGRWGSASGGIGPARRSLDRGAPRPRPERDLGDDGVAAHPAPAASRATTWLGREAARAVQTPRVHKRAALAAISLDPSRSSAVARVDHRAWCAEGACAHTVRASACATAEVLVVRQHAVSVAHRSHVHGRGRERCRITLGPPAGPPALVVHARCVTSGVLARVRGK